MNDRIKELVGQAKCMAEESINMKISANESLYAFAEEFAELIVQECAEVCRLKYARSDQMSREVSILFANDVKQHFGVQ